MLSYNVQCTHRTENFIRNRFSLLITYIHVSSTHVKYIFEKSICKNLAMDKLDHMLGIIGQKPGLKWHIIIIIFVCWLFNLLIVF